MPINFKMKNLKIKASHYSFVIGSILCWGYLNLTLLKLFGLDDAKPEALSTLTNVGIFSIMAISFVTFLLLANLVSYIFIARVLKAPRQALEKLIAERKASDPRENNVKIQGFYSWCLDMAYKKHNKAN